MVKVGAFRRLVPESAGKKVARGLAAAVARGGHFLWEQLKVISRQAASTAYEGNGRHFDERIGLKEGPVL